MQELNFLFRLQALFRNDPNIKTIYDQSNHIIKILVSDTDKLAALQNLIVSQVTVDGNIIFIQLVSSAGTKEKNISDTFKEAFEGNNILDYCYFDEGQEQGEVCFTNRIAQYKNTEKQIISIPYSEIAKEVFKNDLNIVFKQALNDDMISYEEDFPEEAEEDIE